MSDSDIDDDLSSLPQGTLKRIDDAFDRAILESQPEDEPPQKRRRVEQDVEPELAGGFLLDGEDTNTGDTGGGFIVEGNDVDVEQSEPSTVPTHIPLSLIPRALQLIDFDPSDSQVLSVFSNAASSLSSSASPRKYRSSSRVADDEEEDEDQSSQFVSRQDWRAVCAALIPTEEGQPAEKENPDFPLSALEFEYDSGSSDAVQSADLEESGSSEDEYVPDSKSKRSTRARAQRGTSSPTKSTSKSSTKGPRKSKGKGKRKAKDSSLTPEPFEGGSGRTLTPRQVQETLSTFALFFPNISKSKSKKNNSNKDKNGNLDDSDLSKKRLIIRDIANAAASIKEKLTAEEIIEMLSYFSSSSTSSSAQANPSLSFQDFQQLMVAAKLA
ncbi:uncharacterized protein FOMMEDRAFT_144943 [Fomitiporia mediterranea MF3/22]|uniref:uncharacterized protein n=1 Tax=Fomitiporia mediterranea (strain MF3/22) TaxID=694068 RepID=UPI0004407615|nr:uncharacterized protein FOMMEDRAFT_144943 [Fomitiporia mediterranea MF3/22]EJD05355.1 hypothetical protein FOMMEDRAFT_144943 [Fomitiporia mediterranea MF3/22]